MANADMINEILLTNIVNFIKMYGLSESELLSICGIHWNFLSNIRTGRLQSPSLRDVYIIADFFNTSVDGLICYTPKKCAPDIEYDEKRTAKIVSSAYMHLSAAGKAAVRELIMQIMAHQDDDSSFRFSEILEKINKKYKISGRI